MSAPIEAGTVLAGKFRIERVLGRGGMGVVASAHHLQLDERVAIKFLLPETLANREAVARFEREARAAFKIKSEHIVRVTDVGRLDSGAPYMVMEYLRGCDLGQLLQQRGPLPLEEAADYLLQACEAIAEAHSLGIVHRDLKPPNLFLTERADGSPCVKVLDFGISKVASTTGPDGDQGMTSTNAVMGSPLYMSPEQLMSARDVDMRTDIWALGIILYELLSGKAPFNADTLPQLCTTILSSPPAPIRNHRADLPLAVEKLILGCLEKDRGKRIQSIGQFATELVAFAPRRSRLSAERINRLSRAAGFSESALALPPSTEGNPVQTDTVTGFGRTTRRASASVWWFAGVTAGLVLVGGTVVALHSESTPRAEPAVPGGQVGVAPATPAAPPSAEPALPSPASEPVPTVADVEAKPAPAPPPAPPTRMATRPSKPAALKAPEPARPVAPAKPPEPARPAATSPRNSLGGRM